MEIGGKRTGKGRAPLKIVPSSRINPTKQNEGKISIFVWILIAVVIGVALYFAYKWFTSAKQDDNKDKDKGTDGSAETYGPQSAARTAIMTPFYANEEILIDIHPVYKQLYTTYHLNETPCPSDALYCKQLKTDIGQFFTTNTSPTADQFKTFWKSKLLQSPYNFVWPGDANDAVYDLSKYRGDLEMINAIRRLSVNQRTAINSYILQNTIIFNNNICTFFTINRSTQNTLGGNPDAIYKYIRYLYIQYNLTTASAPIPSLPMPTTNIIPDKVIDVYNKIISLPSLNSRTAVKDILNYPPSLFNIIHEMSLNTKVVYMFNAAIENLSLYGIAIDSLEYQFFMPALEGIFTIDLPEETQYFLLKADYRIQAIIEAKSITIDDINTYYTTHISELEQISTGITNWLNDTANSGDINSLKINPFVSICIALLKNISPSIFGTLIL